MKKILYFFITFLLPSTFLYSVTYVINNLDDSDPVFAKFKTEIKKNHAKWKIIKKDFDVIKLTELKRLSIAIYKVKKEDTIFSIAEKLAMVVDSLISFNALANNLSLKKNDKILIPNMDGIILFPEKGVYIEKISKIYQTPIELLMYINNIQRKYIYPKEEVFIPFARMSEEEKGYFLAKTFIFPLKGGRFTSNYGYRIDPFTHRWTFHGGVDIATSIGSKVYAAALGKVYYVGWDKGYGKVIVIKHKFGYTTWYGHLSRIFVKKGDKVSQGEMIALSGNTGRSTGPHLHFEVRRFNLRKNPLEVLDFKHIQRE